MYIGKSPSLISRNTGLTWEQLPWSFQSPPFSALTPFWNITEDESTGLIVFSEYGGRLADTSNPNGPHHSIWWTTDPLRASNWQTLEFSQDSITWIDGVYRHIHGYHINPYMP